MFPGIVNTVWKCVLVCKRVMMTGLLSFFSLLPVRLLKKRGDEEEGEEDEEVRRKMAVSGIVSSQVGGDGSSCPDHQVITTERNLLRKANESLRQVLSDVLKTTAAAEETIGRHVEGLLVPPSSSQRPTWQRAAGEPFRPATEAAGGYVWSGETETDEGLEMSQQMMTDSHSLLPELQLENEEYLMNISSRLQAAVEKLLVAITETTNQVHHSIINCGTTQKMYIFCLTIHFPVNQSAKSYFCCLVQIDSHLKGRF
ncbi:unnamed protein product [Oncorhynchus mykiss]|uniref:Uncharacterized protein n=1 Tax=Oncorhynchus mykiss TaxID=8022 RepID=A0A060WKA1_ONCMY|nr:unnamed protein product [Oncorhynchus mykiss]